MKTENPGAGVSEVDFYPNLSDAERQHVLQVPGDLAADATFDLVGFIREEIAAAPRKSCQGTGPSSNWLEETIEGYQFSDEVPEALRDDAAFRNVFESIMEGLELADSSGLAGPHGKDAEDTALYVWRQANATE